jgi:tetratricopeptide (TPR) repeat protein
VDSWLATISRYTPAQIDTLKRSDLMDDNVTILCDGIWMRVYRKPEAERAWEPVKKKLARVAATARAIGFPLLEAAAVRTLIMVLAEWEDHLDDALALSESSLNRFDADDCRFLIMEVTGRQLSYAGKTREAIEWLERALNCDAYRHSLWRRNVLITLAELHGPNDPGKAAEYTAEAVRISRTGTLGDTPYVETLAEHGMALWRAGEGRQSFEMFEEAANRLFAIQTDTNSWKGLFARSSPSSRILVRSRSTGSRRSGRLSLNRLCFWQASSLVARLLRATAKRSGRLSATK